MGILITHMLSHLSGQNCHLPVSEPTPGKAGFLHDGWALMCGGMDFRRSSSDSLQGIENATGIETQGETSVTSLKSQPWPVGVQSQPSGESLSRR